jgi:hypothetical protein
VEPVDHVEDSDRTFDELPVGERFDTSWVRVNAFTLTHEGGLLTASPPPHEAIAEREQEHCAAASHEEGPGKFKVVSQEAAL